MPRTKISLFLDTGNFAEAKKLAIWADTRGFDAVSMNDHFFSPLGDPKSPQLECFTMLAGIASVTKNVKLMPTVAAMSFRTPPLLAKVATTLDLVSEGRLVLGLGAGWQPGEYHAHGYEYPSNLDRLDQLREGIELLKTMWTEDEPTYRGRWFRIEKAYNQPRPVQRPHPPIMIGGSGAKLLPITAKHASIANLIPPILNGRDLIQDPAAAVRFDKRVLAGKIAELRRLVRECGRKESDVEVGGLALVSIAAEKSAADGAAEAIAKQMGFPSVEAARQSPTLLLGTPEEVLREMRSRIEELGLTMYVLLATTQETRDLLAGEVMPRL